MKPRAVHQFQMSAKDAVYAANFCRATLTESGAIKDAAEEAARLSIYGNLAASYLWGDVARGCESADISLASVIFDRCKAGRSLAEQVLRAEDWRSACVLSARLDDGEYDQGRIVKSGKLFFITDVGDGKSLGIKEYGSGALYGGGLSIDGRRQGFGVYNSGRSAIQYGDWFDDQMHGNGCSEMSFPKKSKQEGRYEKGVLVEPKKTHNLWYSLRPPGPKGPGSLS